MSVNGGVDVMRRMKLKISMRIWRSGDNDGSMMKGNSEKITFSFDKTRVNAYRYLLRNTAYEFQWATVIKNDPYRGWLTWGSHSGSTWGSVEVICYAVDEIMLRLSVVRHGVMKDCTHNRTPRPTVVHSSSYTNIALSRLRRVWNKARSTSDQQLAGLFERKGIQKLTQQG